MDEAGKIVTEAFPEERRRLVHWLASQKRRLRFWCVLALFLAIAILIVNLRSVTVYVATHTQVAANAVLFSWLIAIVILPFAWPEKPGDVFKDRFKSGLNPGIWDFEGEWRVERDEDGRNVLSVTRSERGGLAIPCLSWTDYDLFFDTRIINKATAWTVRASSLNDCVMFQLGPKTLLPHHRRSGLWQMIHEIDHNLPIREKEWYSIRTIVRGAWVTVYATIDGKEHRLFQDRIAGTPPIVQVAIAPPSLQIPSTPSQQIIATTFRSGSFGFRLSTDEHAHFRNVRCFRVR